MSVAKAESLWSGEPGDPLGAVVATFGAILTEGQLKLLRRFRKVTLWLDGDSAGMSGAQHAMKELFEHTEVLNVTPTDDRDLADYSDADEARAMIAGADPAIFAMTRRKK